MQITHLHDWPATVEEAIELQSILASRVDVSVPLTEFEYVAGCDIAYDTERPLLYAAVVVIRVPDGSVVERQDVTTRVTFPYVPGLLSFREVPALLQALAELRCLPDVIMLDGQGIAHPRRFGLARHLGLWVDRPTVGCAKSRLIGEYNPPGPQAGDSSPLTVDGETIGAVLRSANGVRPVFVSPGHRIDLDSSVEVVRATLSGYRHPWPTRLAHMAANRMRAEGPKPSSDV